MSVQSAATIGSGTLLFTTQILPPAQRGQVADSRGERVGTNVIVVNPEDQIAVDAFAVSGVSFGVTPVQIWGPGINPLPRQRVVTLFNDGPSEAFIGPDSSSVIAPSGFNLGAELSLTLPFLHNVQIWARSAGTSQIRFLAY